MAFLIAFLLLLTAASMLLLLAADAVYRHRDHTVDLTDAHMSGLSFGSRVTLVRDEPVRTESPVLPAIARKRLGIAIGVTLFLAFLLLLSA